MKKKYKHTHKYGFPRPAHFFYPLRVQMFWSYHDRIMASRKKMLYQMKKKVDR